MFIKRKSIQSNCIAMNDIVTYYRSDELFTPAEVKLLTKLWGTSKSGVPYNHFEEYFWNNDYQTGLLNTINLLAVIQNDRLLNQRDNELRQRISDCNGKFTESKARGCDYKFDSVESNLLHELFYEAYQKGGLEDQSFKWYDFSMKDIRRIYGLPFKSLKQKMAKAVEYLKDIPEPVAEYEFKLYYKGQDPHSSYKTYGIILPEKYATYNRIYCSPQNIYKKFPNVGKVYYSTLGEPNYWQIYVYDYRNSDRMLQNVLHELLKGTNQKTSS